MRSLDPALVERTYSTISGILRIIATSILNFQSVLQATWEEIRPYLNRKRNKHYVCKCVAESLAGLIRKARSEGLRRLILMMLADSKGIRLEAVWWNSMKGATGSLHSRATSIFQILFDQLARSTTDGRIPTMRRIITALVHHCTSSSIVPIVDIVISRLDCPPQFDPSSSTSVSPVSNSELAALSAFLFTRKGKRFPETLLKHTMLKLAELAPYLGTIQDPLWRRWYVSCVVGCLQAGTLVQWLNPGINLIDVLWKELVRSLSLPDAKHMLISNQKSSERLAFVNMLLSLKWPGVEQFLLPHCARYTILLRLSITG